MASTKSVASPAPSSVDGFSDIIDKILSTKEDAPDFDLQQLVDTIDSLLAHYMNINLEKKRSAREKLAPVVEGLPSASNLATFSESVSNNLERIATQMTHYGGDNNSTAIAVLNAAGSVHWLGLGFLLVAAVLKRLDTINENEEESLKLLNSMNNLAKVILRFKEFPRSKVQMQTVIRKSIYLIVNGAILCFSQKKSNIFKRFHKAAKHQQKLNELRSEVEEMYNNLTLQTSVEILSILENSLKSNPPYVPSVGYGVGIDQQIDDVVKLLGLEEEEKRAVAVVVHGIGGSGKSTLADAVYSSLKDKLVQGWRYSKVTLIRNLEEPNVEKLQSLILQDLTGLKQDVTDFQNGQQILKDIMEKESVFLYIDNALYMEPLRELLPREISNPKKLRLLLTSRKTNVSDVMEDCRIKECKIHPMESLSLEAAIQVLCRKINSERDVNSMLEERPQIKDIADWCRCCPLFLEVVGGHLRKRENKVEAYEKVIHWLQRGEPFSSDKEYRFDEERIMFAFQELELSAREAFLDICSFFSDWEWEEVSCIVGEEDMKCLEEGALIKRKSEYVDSEKKKTNKISIHDLLLQVGRNKSKGNRFRNTDELSKVFENREILSQTKGIWLQSWNERPFHISAKDLDKMSGSLRVFAMGNKTIVEGNCSEYFDNLRFLQAGDQVPNLPIDLPKLTGLTFIDYGLKDIMILSQCKNLSRLKAVKFPNCSRWDMIPIPEVENPIELKQLVLNRLNVTEISCLVRFHNLEKLQLSHSCKLDELPTGIGKLSSLRELNLHGCSKLKQLPSGFWQLSALITLNLRDCHSLQELPHHFEKLSSLQCLNLGFCSGLLRLPESLGNLPSLTYLELNGCKSITSFPHSLGGLKSLLNSDMSFSGCSSLSELPEEMSWLAKLKSISLDGCSSLRSIPNQFSKLSSLEKLNLSGCTRLKEICNDFQCLAKLRRLDMTGCTSLSSLPQGFGELKGLEILVLSGCHKLEELCSDFNCLLGLKNLYLSSCYNLSKLPDGFGRLACLEELDLSDCSSLHKLSDDFNCLASLISLNLSNCKKLGAEWMDSVGAIPNLWHVDIGGSELMIQRWMEMQTEKEKWHFLVLTNSSQQNTDEGRWALVLEVVISKILSEEGILIDTCRLPFHSSSFKPHTQLLLVIDGSRYSASFQMEKFAKNLQSYEAISNLSFSIIYVGRNSNVLASVLGDREVAYAVLNSRTSSVLDKLFSKIWHSEEAGICVFHSSADHRRQGDYLKCFSAWEDITYVLQN